MRVRFVSAAAVATCVLSFCLCPVEAGLVPIAVTAEITEVADTYGILENRINVGDIITGVYIYDLSAPDLEPWEGAGRYEHHTPPAGITLTAGGFVFMTDPDNVDFTFSIDHDQPPTAGGLPPDAYYLTSESNLPLSNSASVRVIRLVLYDYSRSAISSDQLPTAPPVLDDWEGRYIYIGGSIGGGATYESFRIRGDLTSAVLIPEPATFAMFSLGGLILLKKRGSAS